MTVIVDYGVGNLFGLYYSLKAVGCQCEVTGDPEKIENAEKIILPGVGAFGAAQKKLSGAGLIPVLKRQAKSGKPFLGICLGMQLLFDKSYEHGVHEGLGLIEGEIRPLETALREGGFDYKVPHIGWNSLILKKTDCPLHKYTAQGGFVYFVHSFYAGGRQKNIASCAEYGVEVPAVVQNKNVFGCQFHPEKSAGTGLNILKAFCEINQGDRL